LGVGIAAMTLVAGLSACGNDDASGNDVMAAASANLESAKSVSFDFHLKDPNNLVPQAMNDSDSTEKLLTDATLSITVDPAGDSSFGDAPAATPTSAQQMLDQAGAMEVVYTVSDKQVFGFRMVDGAAYLKLDLDAMAELTGENLESTLSTVPGDSSTITNALRDGKWVKVDLNRILEEYPTIDALVTSGYGLDSSMSPQQMQQEMLDALNANSEKTVSTDGDETTVELKVKAKPMFQAMENLAPVADAAGANGSSVQIEEMGDGTMDMTVTIKDDHFTSFSLDLNSAQAVVEPDSDVNLDGAVLELDINDSAEGVTAPDAGDVVDVTDTLMQFAMMFGASAGGMQSLGAELESLDTSVGSVS
jgi:hypothetical protein